MPTLDWIGKKAVENHHKEVPYRLLRGVPELSAGEPGTGNLLVQGDNLEALKALLPYYAGKVKCIYIDPPYNTGNENWAYNDAVNSPEMRQWLGSVVGRDDLSRHDKWLCMMYPRLALLRAFLTEEGAIFISIGNDELANLVLLCDQVFGIDNRVEILVWNTHGHTENQEDITGVHEYIVLYAKNRQRLSINSIVAPDVPDESKVRRDFAENSITKNGEKNPPSIITLPIGFPCECETLDLPAMNNFSEFKDVVDQQGFIDREITRRFSVSYPLRIDPMKVIDGRLAESCRIYSGWMSARKLMKFIENDCDSIDDDGTALRYYLSKNGVVYYRREGRESHSAYSVIRNVGTTELSRYTLERMGIRFSYPKPVELVEYLISFYSTPDDIIMDAFAGSGTTGQAVLSLNRKDAGARRFVLIEIDSEIAISATEKRLACAVLGYEDSKDGAVPGLGGGFNFCELGETLFNADGTIRGSVTFSDLAHHVFFTELREPLPGVVDGTTPLLGVARETAVYLLYNGVLKDKRPKGGNVLTMETLRGLPPHAGPKVVYGTACTLGAGTLRRHGVTFRQIPYEVKSS